MGIGWYYCGGIPLYWESAGVERTPDIHPKRRHLERPDLRRRKCASSTGGNCHGHETMPDDQRRGYKTHRQAHLPRNRAGGPRSHAEEPRAFLAARACRSPALGVAGPQVGPRWEGKDSRAIRQAIVRRWMVGNGRGDDGTGELLQKRRQALPFIFKGSLSWLDVLRAGLLPPAAFPAAGSTW